MVPVVARYVRIQPYAWHIRPCMRIEVYGCKYSPTVSPRPTFPNVTTTHPLSTSEPINITKTSPSSQSKPWPTEGTTVNPSTATMPQKPTNKTGYTKNNLPATAITISSQPKNEFSTTARSTRLHRTNLKLSTQHSVISTLKESTAKQKTSSQKLTGTPRSTSTAFQPTLTTGMFSTTNLVAGPVTGSTVTPGSHVKHTETIFRGNASTNQSTKPVPPTTLP